MTILRPRVFLFFGAAIALLLSSVYAEEDTWHVVKYTSKPWLIPETMTVTVVDDNNKPVTDTKVKIVFLYGDSSFNYLNSSSLVLDQTTNEKGEAVFPLHQELPLKIADAKKSFRKYPIQLQKSDESNEFFMVSNDDAIKAQVIVTGKDILLGDTLLINEKDSVTAQEEFVTLSKSMTVTLKKGKMFKLRVVNQDGKPVPGAVVKVSSSSLKQTHTDENGVWEYGPVYQRFVAKNFSQLCVMHNDYVPWELPSHGSLIGDIVLERGKELRAKVTDMDGKPIVKAKIFLLTQNRTGFCVETFSDKDGNFTFPNLKNAPPVLIVEKEGYTRVAVRIPTDQLEQQQKILLSPAKTLQVRFVTEDGKPFREKRCGFVFPEINLGDNVFFRAPFISADADGLWTWTEAPDNDIEFTAATLGTDTVSEKEEISYKTEQPSYCFHPREEPYTVTVKKIVTPTPPSRISSYYGLQLPPQVTVRVLDENGQPKPNVTLDLFLDVGTLASVYLKNSYQTDQHGELKLDFSNIKDAIYECQWTASVEGYWPTVIGKKAYRYNAWPLGKFFGEHVDILLTPKDGPLTGFVYDEEGQPVENAEVVINGLYNCYYKGEHKTQLIMTDPVMTDRHGKWELPIAFVKNHVPTSNGYDEDSGRIVIKKGGYITLTTTVCAAHRMPTLLRYQKVTGRVVDENHQPLKNVNISIWREQNSFYFGGASTDESGRFVCEFPKNMVSSNEAKIMIFQKGKEVIFDKIGLPQESDNLEYVLKPGKTLRLRFVIDEGGDYLTFPEMKVFGSVTDAKNISGDHILFFNDIIPKENDLWVLEVPDCEISYRFFADGFITQQSEYFLKPSSEVHEIHMISRCRAELLRAEKINQIYHAYGSLGSIEVKSEQLNYLLPDQ